jgi:predicted nucleic acid-binding protein
MIVFFDTSVHVDILRGALDPMKLLALGTVRMSHVVASELLRGARTPAARRVVERLVTSLVSLEPGSWRNAWLEVGRTVPHILPDHEEIGLGRLQNDCLIALTARLTGATLVTRDSHFKTIRAAKSFALELV